LFLLAFLFVISIPVKRAHHMLNQAAGKRSPLKRRRNHASRQVVAVEPCNAYNPDRVYHSLVKLLQAIRFNAPRNKKILLKPNIIAQNTPEQATTTHPAVVDAVCRFFTEHACHISIGDSSAFYQGGGTNKGLETSGMAEVAKKYGARIIPFETTRLRKITTQEHLNPLYVTEAVFEHDLVINLPKLKVHQLARYTGAIKNMYGCVVGGTKQLYHTLYQHRENYQEQWGKPLVDVYEAATPHLSIMDAIIGLDKNGPAANGEPRFTGLILASTSGPALDVVACGIIGFDPYWVPAVREAIERGLVSPDHIEVRGHVPSIPYVRLPDLIPKKGLMQKLDDYFFEQFIVTPKIERKKCVRCDACVKQCAASAIAYDKEKLPVIDYAACIYCYCCEQYCAYDAIRLHGSTVNHLIRMVRFIIKL
jgi:uncharacterized protein (DUF362 family)/Pyruvate/2-oxoacid:ferredoxin oxidoreductase delta subunit